MSYNDLTPGKYTPEELAEEINIEVEENRSKTDALLSLAVVLEDIQDLHGDDPIKWNAVKTVVQLMNDLDEEAVIELEDDGIRVKRGGTE